MAVIGLQITSLLAAVVALLYQFLIRDVIRTAGITREPQSINEFPYQCRRIIDPLLEGCEDMWLDRQTNELYLACTKAHNRQFWLPNMGRWNAKGRHEHDAIVVLDLNKAQGQGFKKRVLKPVGLQGDFSPLSIAGTVSSDGGHQFWIVNNKPYRYTNTGNLVDNTQTGANSTIELFEHRMGSDEITHVKTFGHSLIATPNNVAPMPDGSFYISNDHGLDRVGLFHKVSPFISSGNVVHCTATNECQIVANGLSFPNEPLFHPQTNRLLVPSAGIGSGVYQYEILPDYTLRALEKIKIPYPIDNMSLQPDGTVIVAAYPKLFAVLNAFEKIAESTRGLHVPPAVALRLRRLADSIDGQKWTWEKILEDGQSEVLPLSTTALEDSAGRLWFSSVLNPWIAVCDPKK